MKIEKINDNQIRCTLNRADLASRQIKLSELAYGTEKAKDLFRDMMQQAANQFGFEAEDIPLMIEAIPVSAESIILVITKVEDPEELDTRFSKFTQNADGDSDAGAKQDAIVNSANDILNMFKDITAKAAKLKNEGFIPLNASVPKAAEEDKAAKPSFNKELIKQATRDIDVVYSFTSIDRIAALAVVLAKEYSGENSLYYDDKKEKYYLVLNKSFHTPESFNKVCNILSEYGRKELSTYATAAYLDEHYECIVAKKALQSLAIV